MDPTLANLCIAGCGFFGSQAFAGMCSLCHKKKTGGDRPHVPLASAPTQRPAATGFASEAPATTSVSASVQTVEVEPAASAQVVSTSTPSTPVKNTSAAAATAAADEKPPTPGSSAVKQKNRCALCRQKVGLLGFTCKCEQLFCSQHRHSDQHQCTFDFKSAARRKLEHDNPVIVADKIQNRI